MEYLIAIVSFVAGWLAGKVLDHFYENAMNNLTISKRKKEINKQSKHVHMDIFEHSVGIPYFSSENLDVELSEDSKFYLAFPEELKLALPKSAGTFRNQDELMKPLTIPGYSDEEVNEAIEKARIKVAQMFVERKDGLYFNGAKYGLFYSDGFSRTNDHVEDPILHIKLFNTDHYTHRVVEEAIAQLRVPEHMLKSELNNRLSWIRTSLGISVIVVLKRTNQILMTKRSSNSSFSEGKSWIYVSATETFTETDYDSYTKTADLTLCLKRGILEELGITSQMYYDSTIKFYGMFYETHFYQDGIVASIELKENVTFDEIVGLNAKDKALEVDKMFLIDNTKQAIDQFIREHSKEMRSQTIYSLKAHAARLKR